MDKTKKLFVLALAPAFLLAVTFIHKTDAKTITATGVSYSAVSAAVSSASDGDTVKIPAGTATWSSTLNITKAINVIGAGKDSAQKRERECTAEMKEKGSPGRSRGSPERADGEQAFWIDGEPAARFGPGTVKGYWMRDGYRLDEEDARAKPFEGFRWRRDMGLNVNKFWLLHYVTDGAFKRAEEYAAKHPGFRVNTETATIWFDDIVVATEYIGPLTKP